MADKFELKALITAVDKLSPTLKAQMKTLNAWKRQFEAAGSGGLAMGAGLAAGMAVQIKAFAEVENASIGLKNTLMNKDGIAAGFEQINKIATDLGNKLPGTTADFANMASQLKGLGVDSDTIAGGALQATAYLAVVGERFGVTYDSAAEAVGKVSKAFGIAAKDLVPFADSVQRTLHLGVNLTEMQYAMAKIAPRLKSMGVQGLDAANDMVPLVSMLVGMGITGETAGTGIEKVIAGFTKAGRYKNVKDMVKELEKFQNLAAPDRIARFKKLFGDEGERAASIIAAGGYQKILKDMQEQASLQQRVNNSLGSLTNLWGAATGTFTNAMAAFSDVYSPELKAIANWLNDVAGGLMDWAKANGPLIKAVLASALALTGLKLAFGGVAIGIGLVTAAMKASPIMLIAQALALAAPLIISNWGTITEFLGSAWDSAIQRVMNAWKNFISFIQPGIDTIKYLFNGIGSAFSGLHLPDFGGGSSNGMRPPGYKKPNLSSGRVGGAIDVNFNNAPPGMRVAPATTGPVAVNPNVGYRTIGTGLP